jgi:hypothetical protein
LRFWAVLDIFISSKIDCKGNEVRGSSVPAVSLCPSETETLALPSLLSRVVSFVRLSGRFSKTLDLSDFAARTGLGKYQEFRQRS